MEIRTEVCQDHHIDQIIESLHPGNVAELKVLFGSANKDALMKSVSLSDEVYAVTADGNTAAIFGFREPSKLIKRAYPWLICSSIINEYGITFLKHFKKMMKDLQVRFNALECIIYSENTEVIKMLEWVGFKILDEVYPGVDGSAKFYKMVWVRGDRDVR
jgi:hypothetical protein